MFVVIVAPCPVGALLWQPLQSNTSFGEPVFPPGDPEELELEVVG